MSKLFIAGIDTDIGKTYATGLLAKYLLLNNKKVTTMKLAQTGCSGISEDISIHREIMEISLTKFDTDGTTCPYVFKFPASPHLAANMENEIIDVSKISKSIDILSSNFEYTLIEGVGGLMVPLNKDFTSLDFIKKENLDVILVSSPKLGSINHTLLSIDALKATNINLLGIIYNTFGDFTEEIKNDSINVFKQYLAKNSYPKTVVETTDIANYSDDNIKNLFNKFKI